MASPPNDGRRALDTGSVGSGRSSSEHVLVLCEVAVWHLAVWHCEEVWRRWW